MSDDLILTQRHDARLTVTVNRPGKANSLTTEMLVTLRDIFRAAAKDDDLRAVILTGAGGGRVLRGGRSEHAL